MVEIISSSPGELQPVFDAMLERATRICEATFGNLFLREGQVAPYRRGNRRTRSTLRSGSEILPLILPKTLAFRWSASSRTKEVAHVPDIRTDNKLCGPECPCNCAGRYRGRADVRVRANAEG